VAFIIVSAGQMTNSRNRTIRAMPLFACVSMAVVALSAGSVTLGYRLAVASASQSPQGASFFDPGRPEGRALMERVGTLSGRLTRVEAEAADLSRRFGTSEPTPILQKAAVPDTARSRKMAAEPAGGPLVLANDFAAAAPPADDYGTGLAHLEANIARLEDSLNQLADAASVRDLTDMATPNRSPVLGSLPRISSGFGVRLDPFTGHRARHMGLDIPAPTGTAVLASGGGRVSAAGPHGAYGNAIVIDHGNGMQTLYGHCSRLFVRVGDVVMPRQRIAAVGSTGRSTGPHLHFEVIRNGMRIEPGRFLAQILARKPVT
jgi:murein DD-endopeptidase MepM/ murein hydrolase activator NlpD